MNTIKKIQILAPVLIVSLFVNFGFSAFAGNKVPVSHLSFSVATEKKISGIYRGKKEKIKISGTQTKRVLTIVLEGKDKTSLVKAVYDLSKGGKPKTLNVAGINLIKKLSPDQEIALKQFGMSDVARAILESSVYFSWQREERGFKHGEEFFLPFSATYSALSKYYSDTNKKLIQPLSRQLPDGCFLKNYCDMVTDMAMFGCNDGTTTIDVLPLIDGLPKQCRFAK